MSLKVGPRRRRDLDEDRAAGALAALDPVARDRNVVGRSRPGEVDLAVRDSRRREPARICRRLRVRRRRVLRSRSSRSGCRPRRQLGRGSGTSSPPASPASLKLATVGVADLDEVRTRGSLAALDPVARDATLSVDAVQARSIWLWEAAVAVSPVGAVGACVSGVVALCSAV